MQWAWATSLDQLWRSPSFPMWVTLIAAGFFALVVLIVLLRADKTMANGALAVIALLAIGIASTTTVRGFGPPVRTATESVMDVRVGTQQIALAPAMACLDGLAGDSVEAGCEKAIFGSADTAAAAVSYAAGQVSRVVAAGGSRSLTPEQQILKRTVERDRYGLVAQVVAVRDRCIVADCPLFRVLSDSNQIKSNMSDRLYDTLVARYSSSWNSAAAAPPASQAASLLPSVPSGRPNTVDFANSAAIPPVNIMTPEPSAQQAAQASASASAPPSKQPAASGGASAPSAKQQAAPTQAPASKAANAQAQAKRTPSTPSATPPTAAIQAQPPVASIGRPRVVAPVPFVPSQPGDEN